MFDDVRGGNIGIRGCVLVRGGVLVMNRCVELATMDIKIKPCGG